MNVLQLDEAIREIAQTSQRATERQDAEPYVFVVGAGISRPSAPLAFEIQEHCEREAKKLGVTREPTETSAVDKYSYWFTKAYPNAIEQQKYLQGIIEGKPITAANLRLAHLLIEGALARVVVTPNFDEFISKAMAVFGLTSIRVCDHPQTVERIDPEEKELQIVHVHGTYKYYDLVNLKPQIASRAESSSSTSFTMLGLLDRILVSRSPIVVGYSGWEGDVIMSALYRRLSVERLRYRMYWFCYRRDAMDLLPRWLMDHEDVMFVLPAEPEETKTTRESDDTSRASADPPVTSIGSNSQSKDMADRALPAQVVFEALIRHLGLQAPELLRDPFGFFIRQLTRSIPGESQESREASDPYSLLSVANRMSYAQRLEREATKDTEASLEKVRDAVRRSSYLEAVRLARDIRARDLDQLRSNELIELLILAFRNLRSGMVDSPEAAVILVDICRAMPPELDSNRLQYLFSGAHLQSARARYRLGQKEEALLDCDEVVRAAGSSEDRLTLLAKCWALELKANLLAESGKTQESLELFDTTILKAAQIDLSLSQWVISTSLMDKARVLIDAGRPEEAFVAIDEHLRRFKDSTDDAIETDMAWNLLAKADALASQEKTDEANTVRDRILGQFDRSPNLSTQVVTAWALYDKAKSLEPEDAIPLFDETVKRFGDSTDIYLKGVVASALNAKARILGATGRENDAIATLEDSMRRLGQPSEDTLICDLARAMLDKGRILEKLGRADEARKIFDQIIKRFKASVYDRTSRIVREAEDRLGSIDRVSPPKPELDLPAPPIGAAQVSAERPAVKAAAKNRRKAIPRRRKP